MEELLLHVCHTLTQRLDSHPGSQSWKDLVSAANQPGSSALSDSDVFLSRAYGLQLRGRFPRLAAFYFLLTVSVLAWNPTLLLWLGIWTVSVLLWDRGIKSSSVSCFKTQKSWAFLCPELIFNVDKDPKHKRNMEDFSHAWNKEFPIWILAPRPWHCRKKPTLGLLQHSGRFQLLLSDSRVILILICHRTDCSVHKPVATPVFINLHNPTVCLFWLPVQVPFAIFPMAYSGPLQNWPHFPSFLFPQPQHSLSSRLFYW